MRIAVTGGIAEGKSTVLGYLREFGYTTLSGDEIARECFHEVDVQSALAGLLATAPPVTPSAMRAALAGPVEVRRAVNRIMHPRVVERMSGSSAQFIEVPLLIETCLHPLFDGVWVVTCGPEEQFRRLRERGGSELAMRLIEIQLNSFVKTPFGDVVVRTNAAVETVKRYVRQEADRVHSYEIAQIRG
jgi:dephospho-CoA kinase